MTAYQITMRSGGVIAGRDPLAAAFRALPDGDYAVSIAQVGDPAAAISEIVEWYGGLDTEMQDPALGWVLTEKARVLVTLCHQLGEQVRAAKDMAVAEANALDARRVVLAHELQDEAKSAGVNLSDAATKRKTDYLVKDLTESANLSARIAAALKTTHDSATRVLNVISNNHIPMLRRSHGG
jgi:hypothetical protein